MALTGRDARREAGGPDVTHRGPALSDEALPEEPFDDGAPSDDALFDDALTEEALPREALTDEAPDGVVVGDRRFGVWLVVSGAIGLVAAFVLAVERFALAQDPSYVPSCSINPVLSCGSVMATPQAALLGFPNPLIGVMAFPVLLALGAVLLGGGHLARWVQLGLQVGVTAGTVLVGWLISQSLYSINALCPYCMVVWAVMLPLFWTVTARSLEQGALPAPPGLVRGVVDLRVPLVLVSCSVVVTLVGVRFWDYWQTLLPFT